MPVSRADTGYLDIAELKIELKIDRTGLVLAMLSLIAMTLLAGIAVHLRAQARDERIHALGAAAAGAVAAVPLDLLGARDGRAAMLERLLAGIAPEDIAYAMVADRTGQLVAQIGERSSGDAGAAHDRPVTGAGIVERERVENGRAVLEFGALIATGSGAPGSVRIGLRERAMWPTTGDLAPIAWTVLPLFVFAALVPWLVRLQLHPLAAAVQRLALLGGGGELPRLARLPAPGAVRECLNAAVGAVTRRFQELESAHTSSITAGRLVAYRKTRIEVALHALPEAILLLDGDGTVSFASARLGPLIGIAAESTIGRGVHSWCEIDPVKTLLVRYQAGSERAWRPDSVDFVLPHAPDRHFTAFAIPLPAAAGTDESAGTVVVFRDTSQEHSARRAREDFIAHLAHELKSPLQVLTMYSEVLLDHGGSDPSMLIEASNAIRDESERMAALVNDLLNVARIETGAIIADKTRVKLPELLRDLHEQLLPGAVQGGAEFRLEVPAEMSAVVVDKSLLRTAVKNLVTNAIKYNRPGGRITLSAEETDESILVRVRDEGIGIAPEDRTRVFEKFFRSSDPDAARRGGHGLGLFLTRSIVEMHNGAIDVESTPGSGSVFTIALGKSAMALVEAL